MVLMKRWSIIRCRMSTLLLPAIYNGQQYIYKSILVFDIYILKPKSLLIDWGVASSSSEQLRLQAMIHRQKKIKSFWHKKLNHLQN